MKATRRAILLIDRGSREPEVTEELRALCDMVKTKGGYDLSTYCFLEVIPPFIEEGIEHCLSDNIDYIVVMPYFLYPGMKLKESVKQCARICHNMKVKVLFTKPLSYHMVLQRLILERIDQLKSKINLTVHNRDCDILVIGHGSSDRAARTAFEFTINGILPNYKSVNYCFLELDKPDIAEGIKKVMNMGTGHLIVVPYFLHEGAHVKRDIKNELGLALAKYNCKEVFLTTHLGAGDELVEAVIDRAKEAESKIVIS
ncbi:MAG TPA: CbiX/SirB N-terminal domain-containing protein [Nitrososphaeraceae archaeon]